VRQVSAGYAVWRFKNARRLGRDRGVHTHASHAGGGAEHLSLRWDDHWKHGLARESRLKGLGNSDTPPVAVRARAREMRETTHEKCVKQRTREPLFEPGVSLLEASHYL
jgi:hypothetical protein